MHNSTQEGKSKSLQLQSQAATQLQMSGSHCCIRFLMTTHIHCLNCTEQPGCMRQSQLLAKHNVVCACVAANLKEDSNLRQILVKAVNVHHDSISCCQSCLAEEAQACAASFPAGVAHAEDMQGHLAMNGRWQHNWMSSCFRAA